jgi:cellulose synthase/poly-beta-1,6-N-acetylglucosamine synthase-like glycosyltransferase
VGTLFQIIFWLFITASILQLGFWLFIFRKLARLQPEVSGDDVQPPVSIIICARNEAKNLKKNLPRFLNQNYRSFEIIVVNDHSTDSTCDVVLNFQSKYTNLHLIEHRKSLPGKKAALTKGIEAASFDIIAVSDADCCPASADWLATMQRSIRGNVQIGLGYSPYCVEPGFLNLFIRFETVYTAIQYLSFALAGMPYMGVGRNLVYHKSLFQQERGFHKHNHIASGDDDLFINAVANRSNTKVILDKKAFVFSQPKVSWRGYYYQKARHLTTATSYRFEHQVLLGALAASHAGHYVLGLALVLSGKFALTVLLTYLVRIVVVSWTCADILRKLNEPTLRKWVPLLDAVYVLFYFVFAPVPIIGKKIPWK